MPSTQAITQFQQGTYANQGASLHPGFVPTNRVRVLRDKTLRFGPLLFLALLVLGCLVGVASAATWTISPRGSVVLNTTATSGASGLSGVAYLGTEDGVPQFLAVEDGGNRLVEFGVATTADGTLQSATATAAIALAGDLDREGIVYNGPTRNSVWISSETPSAVREYSLADGTLLGTAPLPAVYAEQVGNRGLESLTQSIGCTMVWTANEEALTIDGPLASDTAGTTVRLQLYDTSASALKPSGQYAYQVDPIHSSTNPNRSGLSDLVALPDGTLIALERSAAQDLLNGAFRSRLYQIDFAGATDISDPAFDAGLIGASYTPVTKTLLWSGKVGGLFGENLEGIALGPQLDDGSWLLVGVVDDGDPASNNTVVTFAASPPASALAGDYNASGEVDEWDYRTWRDTFGAANLPFADGNQSGIVDLADYTVWRDHLGSSATVNSMAISVPEPATLPAFAMLAAGIAISRRRRPASGTASGTPARRSPTRTARWGT